MLRHCVAELSRPVNRFGRSRSSAYGSRCSVINLQIQKRMLAGLASWELVAVVQDQSLIDLPVHTVDRGWRAETMELLSSYECSENRPH